MKIIRLMQIHSTETFIFKIDMRAKLKIMSTPFALKMNMPRVHLHCSFCTDPYIIFFYYKLVIGMKIIYGDIAPMIK